MADNTTTDRNSRGLSDEPRDRDAAAEPETAGQANAPVKGTDIPATTDLETIDREKGKRTTM